MLGLYRKMSSLGAPAEPCIYSVYLQPCWITARSPRTCLCTVCLWRHASLATPTEAPPSHVIFPQSHAALLIWQNMLIYNWKQLKWLISVMAFGIYAKHLTTYFKKLSTYLRGLFLEKGVQFLPASWSAPAIKRTLRPKSNLYTV